MVDALKKACRKHGLGAEPGDQAFCLVDADVNPKKNSQLSKADAMSESTEIILIVSSPCFEVWCLCHYGSNCVHYRSSAAVVDDLTKKLPAYRKSGEGLYRALAPKTAAAITNAKALEKACINAGYAPHTVQKEMANGFLLRLPS